MTPKVDPALLRYAGLKNPFFIGTLALVPFWVVGDFNAPRRSRALCELPAGYRHAYDTAGTGCGYTWPVPIPMYALDHSLHSASIVPVRYTLESSVYSDHRLQIFDFAWRAEE